MPHIEDALQELRELKPEQLRRAWDRLRTASLRGGAAGARARVHRSRDSQLLSPAAIPDMSLRAASCICLV
jgi:hypothetical protein